MIFISCAWTFWYRKRLFTDLSDLETKSISFCSLAKQYVWWCPQCCGYELWHAPWQHLIVIPLWPFNGKWRCVNTATGTNVWNLRSKVKVNLCTHSPFFSYVTPQTWSFSSSILISIFVTKLHSKRNSRFQWFEKLLHITWIHRWM